MIEKPQEPMGADPFLAEEPFVPTDVLEQSTPGERRILGMTAAQRFMVMLLIFLLTVLLGSLLLVVTGKVVIF